LPEQGFERRGAPLTLLIGIAQKSRGNESDPAIHPFHAFQASIRLVAATFPCFAICPQYPKEVAPFNTGSIKPNNHCILLMCRFLPWSPHGTWL
jgi:hypothetical protein